MAKLVSLDDYRSTKTKGTPSQEESLQKTATDYLTPILVPIEITPTHLGVLLGEHYHSSRTGKVWIQEVEYIRRGKSIDQHFFERVEIGTRRDLFIASTSEGEVLPFPSQKPYLICSISAQEYIKIKEKIVSSRQPKVMDGVEMIVEILALWTSLTTQRKGWLWNRRHQLLPLEGYADSIAEWYGYEDSLKVFS